MLRSVGVIERGSENSHKTIAEKFVNKAIVLTDNLNQRHTLAQPMPRMVSVQRFVARQMLAHLEAGRQDHQLPFIAHGNGKAAYDAVQVI